ncbi:glycosyltransferase family 4 protein, partial [Algoriphagus marinus]|uniref:glycosyltransferase family 4 protein n=1 Tax=Algoriphagus marinus TaxID=1925762 RepID=UPI00094B96EC
NNLDFFLTIDEFKITHTHFGHVGELICFLKKIKLLKKCEIVHSFHGFDLLPNHQKYYQFKYENLFKFCKYFTVNSKYTYNILEDFPNVESKKIRSLPVSLDTSYFSNSDFKPNKDFRIIFIGRLIDWKSPINALKILQILHEREFPIFLDIIGEGPERKSCEDFIQANNLQEYAFLLGALDQKDIKVKLSQSSVFIAPGITDPKTSRAENQGLVVQEAQAMELPVIVSSAGGMKYGLIDGVTGYVVEENDIEGFVEKIIHLFNFPEIIEEMGKRGRKYVQENFDYKVLGKKLLEIYSLR